MLEHSAEVAVGRPVERLVTPEHAIARLGRRVLETGVPTTESQQEIERRTGGNLVVDVAVSPLFDDASRIDGAVLVLRDRSTQRRLERLEGERERFAAFGRIAAGLAHEVKNPLGGIRGAAELLARRADDDKSRETAALIVREATRIASLVDDFMVFARGDQLRLAPTNVHFVLDGVLDLLAHDPLSKDVVVDRIFDPSIPELWADPDRLTQVFLNLTRNALQAMEGSGGRLAIRTGMTLDHRIALSPGRRVPTLGVWIEDTGRGMDESELRQATTPFFTSRAGGTGLGLAVADYWISQHGGSLQLDSVPGEGTCARVVLPLRREP
jgi:two-component system nitrogen regulation sensor histidine kinase GlnL